MQTAIPSKQGKIVYLTKEIADKIKVLRLKDVGINEGGFQRRLDTSRVVQITSAIKKNKAIVVPPITVAEVGQDLICVDGQHRLEAFKRSPFNLIAQIVPMTMQDATNNFIVMNATARRVSLIHRLRVDPTENGKKIRAMADKYECEPSHLYSVVSSLVKGRTKSGFTTDQIGPNEWKFIEGFMEEWTKDRRWKSASQCYRKV